MNTEQATQVLIRCVEVAQEKGAYSLNDARLIIQAIDTLKAKPKMVKPENVPSESSDKKVESVTGEKLEKPGAEA